MIKNITDNLIEPFLTNPGQWLLITIVTFGVAWLIFGFLHKNQLETMKAQLDLSKDRISEYKSKLDGASPTEAAGQIKELEERVQALTSKVNLLGPRRLTEEQKASMISALSIGKGSLICIDKDGASSDAATLSADLVSAFEAAGWEVRSGVVLGIGNPPPTGVSVTSPNQISSSVQHQAVINALNAAGIRFDLRAPTPSRRDLSIAAIAEIMITTAVS